MTTVEARGRRQPITGAVALLAATLPLLGCGTGSPVAKPAPSVKGESHVRDACQLWRGTALHYTSLSAEQVTARDMQAARAADLAAQSDQARWKAFAQHAHEFLAFTEMNDRVAHETTPMTQEESDQIDEIARTFEPARDALHVACRGVGVKVF